MRSLGLVEVAPYSHAPLMEHCMKKLLACVLVAATSGCPDVKVDPDETGIGPTVEFDPAKSLATGARYLPFPNDLVRDPTTGKLNLGPQACESPAAKITRENILNKLDGFGTYQVGIQITFTQEVDEASLMGNVVLYQVTNEGTKLDAANAVSIPIALRKGTTLRLLPDACTAPETVNSVVIIPLVPLKQKSTYVAAVLKGVTTTDGKEFVGSSTWGLVGGKTNPVTVDNGVIVSDRTPLDPAVEAQRMQLLSLDMLWKAHAEALAFLDQVPNRRERGDVLVATRFTTQTVTDPLDPAVATSPAGKLGMGGFIIPPMSVIGRFGQVGSTLCTANAEVNQTQCFLKLALGGCDPLGVGCTQANYTKGQNACALYGCAAIADVLGTAVGNVNYQTQLTNAFNAQKPLQGAWSDPINPEPQGGLALETLIGIPQGTMPANGWPVVVYGHGLTLSKETALTFAGRAAAAGFVTVAIDFAGHGSRATRISNDATLGCTGRCAKPDGTFESPTVTCESVTDCPSGDTCGVWMDAGNVGAAPTPTTAGQCYDPFLSTDLAKTRDSMRQTVLDLQRLIIALKSCPPPGCGPLTLDSSKIFYTGVSLGGILGSITHAQSPNLKAAVLSVPGAGWVDLLENTDTVAFRCPLVNGLIDAGILTGTKWTGANTDALCLAPDKAAWQGQPGYATFAATARWALDSADPANFAAKLAPKKFFIQEVIGDTVVPNITTERLAALSGVATKVANADPFSQASPAPSAAVSTNPTESKFLRYKNDSDDIYVHSSLIRPATQTLPGINGFLRMQTDAGYWLNANK